MNLSALQSVVTGRSRSLFSLDLEIASPSAHETYEDKSVLIAGAAGTIARATIKELIPLRPRALWLLDINENGLADTVRWLRTSFRAENLPLILPRLVDISNDLPINHLSDGPLPDLILNFSAIKHVRSERDTLSLLRMLQVNVTGTRKLAYLASHLSGSRIFSVSTDKAANPTNLMGASKRIMEAILLQDASISATSARFANVAFSQGSLLESWIGRINSREPMPVPVETRRFFLSSQEAGQLCLIAGADLQDRTIATPVVDQEMMPRDLVECAVAVAESMSLEPVLIEDANDWQEADGRWRTPEGKQLILLTPRNTEGEKEVEEFTEPNDEILPRNFSRIQVIKPQELAPRDLQGFEKWLNETLTADGRLPAKQAIVDLVAALIPSFDWQRADQILDDRI